MIDIMALLGSMATVIKSSSGQTQDILIYLYMAIITFFLWKPSLLDKFRNKKDKKCYDKEELSRIVADKVIDCIRIREEYDFKIDQVRHSIMRDQMTIAENTLEILKSERLKVFSELLKEKLESIGSGPWATSEQYSANLQIYDKILDSIFVELLNETRRAFRDNGLDEKTDSEFELYVKNMSQTYLAKSENVLRLEYNASVMILKPEELEPKKLTEDKAYMITMSVFTEAKSIAHKAHTTIRELEEEFNEELVKEMNLTDVI